jgi:uncharacterized membrane protein
MNPYSVFIVMIILAIALGLSHRETRPAAVVTICILAACLLYGLLADTRMEQVEMRRLVLPHDYSYPLDTP